jgi:orotate phosphoribosyltransferase
MDGPETLLQLFRDKGAYLEGHFQLSSGLHSSNYIQCARILQFPAIASELGAKLASFFSETDLVLSPALGGIIIGHEVARALGVPFVFCERENKEFVLRRGFRMDRGQKVVVIEDVVTTGLSTMETVAVAEREGAVVSGIGSIVDRSVSELAFRAPYYSLLRLPLAQYKPESCPLCRKNIPLVKPGSRPG